MQIPEADLPSSLQIDVNIISPFLTEILHYCKEGQYLNILEVT